MAIIFNPQETSRLSIERLEFRAANRHLAIPFYLSSIDEFMVPLLPGDLVTVIGRPGNGKTGFMLRWARERAKRLYERNEIARVVMYVTYEQHIEDLNSIQMAAESDINVTQMARGEISESDFKRLRKAAIDRAVMPLWYMGHSMSNRQSRPRISPSALIEALQKLESDRSFALDAVFVDYLQRIPFDGRPESKVVGTMEVLDEMKDFALALNCPFIVGVQAKREVDARETPVPGQDDGQWTSNIEQASDKIFTVCRPSKYKHEGELFGPSKVPVIGYKQMVISLVKQKLGPDNIACWVEFDPAYNKLDDLEVKHYDTRKDVD